MRSLASIERFFAGWRFPAWILSLLIAIVLWPVVLLGVDLHLPPIAT